MKASIRILITTLSAGFGLASPLTAGPAILMYPLARAFGSPSESELAKCRQAFEQMQTRLGTSRVVVQPVMFVDGPQRDWRRDLAESIIQQAGTRTGAKLEVSSSAPTAAPAKLGHNQMRYLWERAAAYGRWVKEAHPAGDYFLVSEVWGRDGQVAAIHVFVFDATGQIAYCRLFNSHQFGPKLPLAGDEPIKLFVNQLFKDLPRDPKQIFPPYGVG